MTAPTPSSVCSQYARNLAAAAPREWEAFVQCFDAYATDVTVAVTAAEQNEVLQKQGQARAFLHLLKLFRDCTKTPKTPPAQPPSAY